MCSKGAFFSSCKLLATLSQFTTLAKLDERIIFDWIIPPKKSINYISIYNPYSVSYLQNNHFSGDAPNGRFDLIINIAQLNEKNNNFPKLWPEISARMPATERMKWSLNIPSSHLLQLLKTFCVKQKTWWTFYISIGVTCCRATVRVCVCCVCVSFSLSLS